MRELHHPGQFCVTNTVGDPESRGLRVSDLAALKVLHRLRTLQEWLTQLNSEETSRRVAVDSGAGFVK